jgi:hypothetical protein
MSCNKYKYALLHLDDIINPRNESKINNSDINRIIT